MCSGQAGVFHAQPLAVDGDARHYFLYVPAAYTCRSAWPLVIDFHGTAVATEADNPEEFYALPDLEQAADAEGFLVARPRSRYALVSGRQVYQWDINPGDLQRNADFARALVAELQTEYNIDPARVYTIGFSNGTNMAAQFLADATPVFHGFGAVAGGLWNPPGTVDLSHAGRTYATTGYRDYMLNTRHALEAYLAANGYPAANLWVRETDAGHELYGWHYREFFEWVDAGKRPPRGTLAAGWRADAFPSQDDLLRLAVAPSGDVYAAATGGDLWKRASGGTAWTSAGHIAGDPAWDSVAPALPSLCFLANGAGIAVGEGAVATLAPGASAFAMGAQVPDFGGMGFGFSFLDAVACSATGTTIVGGGYWSAVNSGNGGTSWSAGSMMESGYPAQVASVVQAPSGTWIAAGYYDYLGRSTDGVTFTDVSPPLSTQWLLGLAGTAAGPVFAVGEAGAIVESGDDGQTWTARTAPRSEDLYGVAFAADSRHGLAVGAHGAAFATMDGGATWQDASTGLDGFVADAVWTSPTTVMVVGERGMVLEKTFP